MDAFVIRMPKTSQTSSKSGNKGVSTDCKFGNLESKGDRLSKHLRLSSDSISHQNITDSSSSDVGALNKIKPERGQRRISDLGGVVVIEKLQKYVEKLSSPDVPSILKVYFIRYYQ